MTLTLVWPRVVISTVSWVQSGGPVTTESIVRFDTWFELFEVFRNKISPHDPRENGGGICEKPKIQNGRRRPYWKCNLKTNWYPKLCNTTFPTNFGRIHFWHRFRILTSPTIKIQDGRLRPYWKCNLKVNGHRNPCNITFPTKCGIESPFLASF